MTERNNAALLPEVQEQVTTEEIQSPPLTLNSFTEFVELPSGGVYYPKTSSLSSGRVEIHLMTSRHEDILSNASYLQEGVMIDKLVANLLVDQNISVDDLLAADKTAIVMAARASAYGSTFSGTLRCPACGKVHDVEVDIEDDSRSSVVVEGHEWDASLKDGLVEIKLPKSKLVVQMHMLDSKAEVKMRNLLLAKQKAFDNAQKAKSKNAKSEGRPLVLGTPDQLAVLIHSINSETDSEKIKKVIENIPAYDTRYLRNAYKDLNPSFSLFKTIECECSYTFETEVGVTADFFWPKL